MLKEENLKIDYILTFDQGLKNALASKGKKIVE